MLEPTGRRPARKPKPSPIRVSGEGRTFERFRLDCAAMSIAGVGQATNEDHLVFAAPGTTEAEQAAAGYVFAVIDGESQGGKGRSAARETGTSLLEILDDPRRIDLRPDLMLHRLQDANDRCHQFIEGRCAATALWLWEDPAEPAVLAAWAHVGDTRLYHHRGAGWKQVTRDHAIGRLLDRAIGQGPGMMVDTGRLTLRPGERLVLLSDGVWNAAKPSSVLPGEPFPTTAEATRRLVGTARLNGSRDDTTGIVITVRPIDADPEPEH